MTTTKHTPGPWNHFLRDLRDDEIEYRIKGAANSTHVALTSNREVNADAAEANARLVAAAPDLLEACKAIVSRIAIAESNLVGCHEFEKARAAIARAEGAQS